MIYDVSELPLSTHANVRCAQRSISNAGIEFVLDYGVARPCGRGCESYSFDRRSWSAAVTALGSQIIRFERYRNLYVIVATDGAIVTVAWRH